MTEFQAASLAKAHPKEVRGLIRSGRWTSHTTGLCQGFVQANLVLLPETWAFDFLLFCLRNPLACPILDVTDPGDPYPAALAEGADLRTDISRYRIFRSGELTEEVTDITSFWQNDFVGFILGCSTTFEAALLASGIRLRHIEECYNPPVYITNIPTVAAGRFYGPLAVSMFPIPSRKISQVVRISSRYPKAHGAPLHIGNSAEIGIQDIEKPSFGECKPLGEDELPVFWACGVTPQIVVQQARPPIMITHAPGHMLLADWRDEQLNER